MKKIVVYYPSHLTEKSDILDVTDHLQHLLTSDGLEVQLKPYNGAQDVQGPSFFILKDDGIDKMDKLAHAVAQINIEATPYFDQEEYKPGKMDRHEKLLERAKNIAA